jgi:uncharacterized membrane protein
MKSWRTTLVGFLTAAAIIATQVAYLFDSDANTTFSLEAVFAALGALGIGIFARDNSVTSEQAGAVPPSNP